MTMMDTRRQLFEEQSGNPLATNWANPLLGDTFYKES